MSAARLREYWLGPAPAAKLPSRQPTTNEQCEASRQAHEAGRPIDLLESTMRFTSALPVESYFNSRFYQFWMESEPLSSLELKFIVPGRRRPVVDRVGATSRRASR